MSSLSQLQIVPDVNEFRDIEKVIEQGEVVELEDQYFYQTQVVYTGMELLHVHELRGRGHGCGDGVLSVVPIPRIEFDAANLEFLNAAGEIKIEKTSKNNERGGPQLSPLGLKVSSR